MFKQLSDTFGQLFPCDHSLEIVGLVRFLPKQATTRDVHKEPVKKY